MKFFFSGKDRQRNVAGKPVPYLHDRCLRLKNHIEMNKKTNMSTDNYVSPSVVCMETATENGFAMSGGELNELGFDAPDYMDGFNF